MIVHSESSNISCVGASVDNVEGGSEGGAFYMSNFFDETRFINTFVTIENSSF